MAATQTQIDTYITDVRTAVAEYGDLVSRKQRLGKSNIFNDKIKLMLVSAYLDCIYDYFLQYPDDVDPDTTNFFTTEEIRDVMQHINNICGTFYIIEL
jgi:hypothetical protein